MLASPFRISAPTRVSTEVVLEPVINALTSLSLLHVADQLPDVDPWISATAAKLTAEQRQHNRLIFEGLGEALAADLTRADFPAYLDALSAQSPVDVRDRFLGSICRPVAVPNERLPKATAPEPQQLLADKAAFVQQIERLYPADLLDEQLQSEVHALINDPLALHNLLVSHLRTLWVSFLADEWRQRLPFLENMVRLLSERQWPETAAEAIRTFIGRELPISISAQLEGVQHIVFSLSPHIGPYASRFGSETTLWVFVRGRAPDRRPHSRPDLDLPLRQAAIKAIELVNPFSALADETRLHILELLAKHGELLAQDIIARLDLSQSSVSRHLKQLTSTGFLIERRSEGANKSYRLDLSKIDRTFFELRQLLSSEQTPPSEAIQNNQPNELRRFLNTDAQIVAWPARQRDRLLILEYVAMQFEAGREYTEKEVNELLDQRIAKQHTSGSPVRGAAGAVDFATLRRYLYNEQLLGRTPDGARYWRRTISHD